MSAWSDKGIWRRSLQVPFPSVFAANVPDLKCHRITSRARRLEHRRQLRPVLRILGRKHVGFNAGQHAVDVLQYPLMVGAFRQKQRYHRLDHKQPALKLRPEFVNVLHIRHGISSLRSVSAQHKRRMLARKNARLPIAVFLAEMQPYVAEVAE